MILFRYLSLEVLKSVVAVTVALLAIIVSGRFVKFLAQAAAGDFAPEILLMVIVYRMPSFLEVVLPLGLFISILLAYGRFYVDSEMTVMNACGLSRRRLLLYTQIPALFIALIVAYISMVVTPDGIRASREKLAQSRADIGVEATVEGRFRLDKNSGRVTYIEAVDRDSQSMEAVFIAQPEPAQENGRSLVSIITAKSGRFQVESRGGEKLLILEEGVRYIGQPGYMDYQRTRFAGLSQLLLQPEIVTYRQELDGKPTSQLWGSERLEDIAALQWRISLSLLVPVAALIAMSLSKTDHRRGRYGKMFPAFMLYMIYLVALNACRDAIAKGEWSPLPGMWVIHLCFFVLGLLLLYRDSIYRHWWMRWRRRRG